MCLYILVPPILPLPDKFCLVLWPEEDSDQLSLERECVVEPDQVIPACTVKIKGKTHEGNVLATGEGYSC